MYLQSFVPIYKQNHYRSYVINLHDSRIELMDSLDDSQPNGRNPMLLAW